MPEAFPHNVFLSHNAKDKAVSRPLAERLPQDGLKVWFDEWECPSPAGAGEGGRRPGEGRGAEGIPAKIEEGLEHASLAKEGVGAGPSVDARGMEPPTTRNTRTIWQSLSRPAEPGATLHSRTKPENEHLTG
jgi:hypothetical protein